MAVFERHNTEVDMTARTSLTQARALNPLVGNSAAETLANAMSVISGCQDLLAGETGAETAAALMLDTIYSALDFERARAGGAR
jgi:hypothetical protein